MKSALQCSDVAFVFAELQPLFVSSITTIRPYELERAISIAVDTAALLDTPVISSGVFISSGGSGEFIEPLAKIPSLVRETTQLFADDSVLKILSEKNRRTVAIAGVSSEIAILHSVLGALRCGLEVHVLVDCCGGLSARTEHAAFTQMEAAGATMSSLTSFLTALAPNLNDPVGKVVFGAVGRLWSWGELGPAAT